MYNQEIQEVCDKFITNGSEFSAYDVTNEIRSTTSKNVSHRDVRDGVHSYMTSVMPTANYAKGYETVLGQTFIKYSPDPAPKNCFGFALPNSCQTNPIGNSVVFDGDKVNIEPSSWITAMFYNKDNRELMIETASGNNYIYINVPLSVVNDLSLANSVGSYFNANIKNVYLTK